MHPRKGMKKKTECHTVCDNVNNMQRNRHLLYFYFFLLLLLRKKKKTHEHGRTQAPKYSWQMTNRELQEFFFSNEKKSPKEMNCKHNPVDTVLFFNIWFRNREFFFIRLFLKKKNM